MLDRQIHVLDDLFLARHNVQKFVGDSFWVAVQNAYPFELFYFAKLRQQLGQHRLAVQVCTVARGILSYNVHLSYPVADKAFGFLDKLVHGNAAETSAYVRYRAVGTAVVTALGDLKV